MGARGEGFLSCKNVIHIKVLHAAIFKFTFKVTYFTVYQRTLDIAISEVNECLQGQRTRSVFLCLSFVFCDL